MPMPKQIGTLEVQDCFLIGLTVRSLVASAHKAGIGAYALDLFSDLDTREKSVKSLAVEYDGSGLESDSLFACIEQLDPNAILPVVYAGGFEHNPSQIERISDRRQVLGNPASVLAELKSPRLFSITVSELGIPAPRTRIEGPENSSGWLYKSAGSSGGFRIGRVTEVDFECHADIYYQEFKSGQIVTATVLCTDEQTQTVGFSEQWCAESHVDGEFIYGGAVALSSNALESNIRISIENAAALLAAHYQFRGLVSLDTIVQNDEWWLLEVNPRPGATFELHEGAESFLKAHCLAFCDQNPTLKSVTEMGEFTAHSVIYASNAITLPSNWEWPMWVQDRAASGQSFEPGDPVCTAYATAGNSEMAKQFVEDRHRHIVDMINKLR